MNNDQKSGPSYLREENEHLKREIELLRSALVERTDARSAEKYRVPL